MTIAKHPPIQYEACKDITILIASFNRSVQIVPLINYYLEFGFYVKVAYNSTDPILLEHQRLELYRSNDSYASRCEILSKHIETKFSILVTDDDLFIGDAILGMKGVLEESNCTSIFGQVVGSWFNNGDYQVSPAYSNFESYSNLANEATDRVVNQYTIPRLTPISMYRITYSSVMATMLRLFGKLEFISTPYVYEHTAEIFINYCGTSTRTSQLYWIRNWEDSSISNSSWNRSLSFLEWFNHPEYFEERKKWLLIIEDFCPKLDVHRLTHLFESNWNQRDVARKSFHLFTAAQARFAKRLLDYFRHKYTKNYSPYTLKKKVDWEFNPNSLSSLLNRMYLGHVKD